MKYFLVFVLLSIMHPGRAQISENGYPEHFIAGVVIGGATSYFVYKKNNNKVKSWFIGAGAATAVGLIKELIDPLIGRVSDGKDFAYTAFGGAIGASIVIPLKRKKKRDLDVLF